jgi:hypothetical protein
MDGRVDRIGCEAGEEKCNICQGSPRGVKRNRESMRDLGRESGRVRWMEEGSEVEVERMEAERMEAEIMFEEEEQRHGVIKAERMRERACCEMTKNTVNWSDTTCLIFYLLVRTV